MICAALGRPIQMEKIITTRKYCPVNEDLRDHDEDDDCAEQNQPRPVLIHSAKQNIQRTNVEQEERQRGRAEQSAGGEIWMLIRGIHALPKIERDRQHSHEHNQNREAEQRQPKTPALQAA